MIVSTTRQTLRGASSRLLLTTDTLSQMVLYAYVRKIFFLLEWMASDLFYVLRALVRMWVEVGSFGSWKCMILVCVDPTIAIRILDFGSFGIGLS